MNSSAETIGVWTGRLPNVSGDGLLWSGWRGAVLAGWVAVGALRNLFVTCRRAPSCPIGFAVCHPVG